MDQADSGAVAAVTKGVAEGSQPRKALAAVRTEVGKAVIGQDPTVWGLVTAFLVRGHVILEGVPGVAKTLMVKALARSLDLQFRRIQFTPDLMPSDVTGNVVYEARTGEFRFRPGPVFTNLLLADELNRTPPKTQAALLEAMEERQVSIEGETHPLPDPFLVVATQNPVEYEGTYPLPEAQLDRFLFKLRVSYPARDAEKAVLRMHHEGRDPHDLESLGVLTVAGSGDLATGAAEVVGVTVGAKAWAWLSGRDFVTPDYVKVLVKPAWRHRVVMRPEVELEGATPDSLLDSVIQRVPVPT